MKKHSTFLKQIFFVVLACFISANTLFAQTTSKWEKIKEAYDNQRDIQQSTVDALGNLYAIHGYDVIRWNGYHWSTIGTISGQGDPDVRVNGIATDAKAIYISGAGIKSIGANKFTEANVLKWDIATRVWSALPPIQSIEVQDGKTYTYTLEIQNLAVFKGALYAQELSGGSLYKLENNNWKEIPAVKSYNFLTTDEGGNFLYTIDSDKVSRYNGTVWTKLGDAIEAGFLNNRLTIATDKNSKIYLCGKFTKIGTTPVNYIAKWNGTKWEDAGNTLTFSNYTGSGEIEGCNTIAVDDNNNVYAGAAFSKVGTKETNTFAKLSGSQWTSFDSGTGDNQSPYKYCTKITFDKSSGYIYAFCSFGIYRLYTKPVTPPSVSATTWTSIGVPLGSDGTADYISLYALITDNNNNLYAGGHFSKIGSTNVSGVAKWDGTKWTALGNGLRGKGKYEFEATDGATIYDLEFDGSGNLYASGTFTGVEATINESNYGNAYSIGKWDGTKWTALCQGCPIVISIALTSTNSIYGGTWNTSPNFKMGIVSNYTSGMATYISKELVGKKPGQYDNDAKFEKYIALDKNNTLYATGNFEKAGTKAIKYLAVWNSSTSEWENVGNGINGVGGNIMIDKTKNILYVVGDFSEADNINAYGAASYNISTKKWSPLGVGYTIQGIVLAKDGTPHASVFHPDWGDYYFSKWNSSNSTWTPITKSVNSVSSVDKFGSLYATGENGEIFYWKSPSAPATTTTTTSLTTTTTQPAASAIPTRGKTLNGTTDFVPLPNTISKGLSGGSTVTIEYWFKGTNIQSAVRLQSDNSSFIVAGWGSNDPQHIISTDRGIDGVKIKTGTGSNLYDNNWHHVAMTWEKNKPDGFKSYVDGVLVAKRVTGNVDLPTFPENTATIVGAFRNNNASSELTNGQVARVRIWKVVRTEAQIKESKDRSADYPTTDPNLLYQAEIPKEQATPTPANQIVRIKSFWKPDQYINTLSGTLGSSVIPSGSKADQWELVKIAGTNFIQIKNVAKPNLVLNFENGTLSASAIPVGTQSSHWELEGRANDIMILKSRLKPAFLINIEGNKLQASEVPISFNSAYWLFETN